MVLFGGEPIYDFAPGAEGGATNGPNGLTMLVERSPLNEDKNDAASIAAKQWINVVSKIGKGTFRAFNDGIPREMPGPRL